MNDKMKKASQLVIGGALCLSLVTGCAKAPDSTPAISQPAATEPSAATKATKPAATTKPTATKPTATTKATTAPAESKATTPSATTLPPETEAPTEESTIGDEAYREWLATSVATTAPNEETEAPTTAPTEAPTEATEAPTEAPKLELDYDEAMAAGNAFCVSEYGWIYDPSLGFNDGYDFPVWYSLEEIAEGGGQEYLNSRMIQGAMITYETFLRRDGEPLTYGINCYCYESNGFVYFTIFYG